MTLATYGMKQQTNGSCIACMFLETAYYYYIDRRSATQKSIG